MSFLLPEAVTKTGTYGLLFLTDRRKIWEGAPATTTQGIRFKDQYKLQLEVVFF